MGEERFSRYLLAKTPTEIPAVPRISVYRRLVRANFRTVIVNAFPLTHAYLGEEGFENAFERFLDNGGPTTPLYRDIPGEMVGWAHAIEHPLADLLEFEWLELAAARHVADIDALPAIPRDLVRPNPTIHIGVYKRAIERIRPGAALPEPFTTPMAYLVWRRPLTDAVEFHKVGLLIARALAFASESPATIPTLAERLHTESPELALDTLERGLREVIGDLAKRDGVL